MSTYNSFITSQSVSSAGSFNLQVSGLNPEVAYRRFFLRISGAITRGASAAAHQPEEISELITKVNYTPKGSKIDINVSGYSLDILSRARYSTRKNASITAASESIDHWLEVPLTPTVPNDRAARPAGEYLENSVLQFTIATTLGEDDITAFEGSVELWAQGDNASPGIDPSVAGVCIQDIADFNGNNLTHRDGELALLLLARRDDYTSVDCRASGSVVYQQATALSLDIADYEHQQFQATQSERTTNGDPLLVAVPSVAGEENYTRLFDIRNAKDVRGVVNFTFSGRTASNAYPYIYESLRG